MPALFTFKLDDNQLVRAQRRLGRLEDTIERDLAQAVAGLLETQTRRRLLSEKQSPDGTPWAKWKAPYRGGAGGLLVDSHALEQSVEGEAKGATATVMADTIYAAVHQFGHKFAHNGAVVPARPYLGISAENDREIQNSIRSVIEEALEDSGPHTKHGRAIKSTRGKIV